ncbi:MAG: helix-turn-helix domain-containing protein [Acidobacteriota bacterium]
MGSVREVVSRAFTQLQNEGLIIMESRAITIPALDSLNNYCD